MVVNTVSTPAQKFSFPAPTTLIENSVAPASLQHKHPIHSLVEHGTHSTADSDYTGRGSCTGRMKSTYRWLASPAALGSVRHRLSLTWALNYVQHSYCRREEIKSICWQVLRALISRCNGSKNCEKWKEKKTNKQKDFIFLLYIDGYISVSYLQTQRINEILSLKLLGYHLVSQHMLLKMLTFIITEPRNKL